VTYLTIADVALGLLAVLAAALYIRNDWLFTYRMKLIDMVSTAAQTDIAHRVDWRWRYAAFEAVSSGRMLFQFWRRFDSFYPDCSFTERRWWTEQELRETIRSRVLEHEAWLHTDREA